ncbi:hypothetical protein A2973_05850 [Candidatus Gottesmanbacteria bacterium RIFCSPLOWO2_01_FULL_49_10]|uniref:DNA polymerase III subunit delta n=1 Tax=Candidatus Gottesmanbacteria bacterium RIFCSPLOWO2_01_FULL_49_10 TaxID=1798396 RepID=A0A1F6AX61_9BACT|nr:MAG: hypothetical protein UY10_C0001G0034 [Microgenomates group bacterium GW2011_GWA2_47_8]OGG29218.1 MAG: hypothetical protein A2973_05850 [Candidatus Gottesmanbacteria bacterium RIFCSPLOWO2_01_FULL_49_10]
MHAYLVTGGSQDDRLAYIRETLAKATIAPIDQITIQDDEATIGIDAVRTLTKQLTLSPIASRTRGVVIKNSHSMSLSAQNAFLKTLEEPPGDALIILETAQPDALLPTILSRCHSIRVVGNGKSNQSDEDTQLQCVKTLKQLLSSSVGERLKLIDTHIRTRDEALAFVDLSISAIHKELVDHETHTDLRSNERTKLLRALLVARTHILGNITPKLTLDVAFLPLSNSLDNPTIIM